MANSIFLQLDGLTGSSTEEKHKEWIELLSVNWSGFNPVNRGSDGNVTAGSVDFQNLSCVKTVDATTPTLLDKMANGLSIPTGKIELCRQQKGMIPLLTYELTTVYITSLSLSGMSGDASVQTEDLGLFFREVKVIYSGQNEDGTAAKAPEFGWDIGKNKQA